MGWPKATPRGVALATCSSPPLLQGHQAPKLQSHRTLSLGTASAHPSAQSARCLLLPQDGGVRATGDEPTDHCWRGHFSYIQQNDMHAHSPTYKFQF